MLFNSSEFPIFFLIVFLFYWIILKENHNGQNIFLLLSSYYFYGQWDWRFLFLIIASSTVDFIIGLKLGEVSNIKQRKILLWISILFNLGVLGVFKYYNFFVLSFVDLFGTLGISLDPYTLNIIIPVGISFYTFQTMSYTIDVYRNQLPPAKNLITFFAFVSFFPQLVAGPIERAKNLLPQFEKSRTFDRKKSIDGLRQILWGFYKKIVIADNCAVVVTTLFENPANYSGSTLLIGAIFFSFQIYGDFSGYSDIAIGTARILGFDLMKNFSFPYFSRDIAEFWRRWHISLSTWFRDYLYIPLGGSRGSKFNQIRNTFIIFLVSGFWHGANWTFVIWGGLHAACFLPLLVLKQNRKYLDVVAQDKLIPTFREFLQIISTFIICSIAWVFFRATTVSNAIEYLGQIFSPTLISWPSIDFGKSTVFSILFCLVMEWVHRKKEYGLQFSDSMPKIARWSLYYLIIALIFFYGGTSTEFIYFQF